MEQDWTRLGHAIHAARTAQGISQSALARRAGLRSVNTVQALEKGYPRARMPPGAQSVARALGWADGSVEVILAGGDPIPGPMLIHQYTDEGAPPDDPLADRLPLGVARTLEDGVVVEHLTVDLPSGNRVVVAMVRGEGVPATAEERRRQAEEWEEIRARILTTGQPFPERTP